LSRPIEVRQGPRRVSGGLAAAAGLSILLALGACQPRPATAPEAEPQAPLPAWPAFDYETASGPGRAVYRLDPQRSRIDVITRSGGPLARFGHDHVVVVTEPAGYLLLTRPIAGSRADLRFAVHALDVDPPDARRRHGLDGELSAEDIAGTRDNLLNKVLDAARWPFATLSLDEFGQRDGRVDAVVAISLNGRVHETRQPFALTEDDGAVTVEGSFVIRHEDFGLEPYSALSGGLRVAQEMEVRFTLVGQAAHQP
jgi:hypothetical protein